MKNLTKWIVVLFTITMMLVGMGCAPEVHEHLFSTEWKNDAKSHWHVATCEHSSEVSGKADHTFGEWKVNEDSTEEEEGQKERSCTVCGYKETDVIAKKEHVHTIATDWSSDAEKHWHVASCGKEEHYEDVAAHNHTDYQYDIESGKDIRICTVCSYVDEKDHLHTIETDWSGDAEKHWHSASCGREEHKESIAVHTEDSGTVTTEPTCVTKGVRTFKCNVCDKELRTEEISELYSSPVDAETGESATASSTYIYFGVFPKTVLASDSAIAIDETETKTMGANTYCKGNDGNWYAKVTENCYSSSGYTYTDGTTVKWKSSSTRYFKVEPIKWKVLTTDYNGTKNTLLLAEDILTANVPYYVSLSERTIGGNTVYVNNYKYSTIRAYLNGKYESDDTQSKTAYENKGFLQTAFTSSAQAIIIGTTVNNAVETAGYSVSDYAKKYACDDTTDKIFLLSESEVINSVYGFEACNNSGTGNARIRVTTDYAKANYAWQTTEEGYGSNWWLRSPYDSEYRARCVLYDGNADGYVEVDFTNLGVVPALTISLQ